MNDTQPSPIDLVFEAGCSTILLVLAYLLLHSLLVIAGRKRASGLRKTLLVNLALLAGFTTLLLLEVRSHLEGEPGFRILRLWAPVVFFWWAYKWSGKTLDLLYSPGFTYDPLLVRIEEEWLGQPSLWLARGRSRLSTEVAHLFYAGYFFYLPVIGLALYLGGRDRDFEAMSFAVLLGYLVSYVAFALFPVMGPRWALVEEGKLAPNEQRLRGYALTWLLDRIMYGGVALKGGAMPSSHSSTAVVFAFWSWNLWGPAGAVPALASVIGLWISAVYGRYHYVLDIVIGILLGLASLWLADRWIVDPPSPLGDPPGEFLSTSIGLLRSICQTMGL